jgi:hypothetical protein
MGMEAVPSGRESVRVDRGVCAVGMIACALAISVANTIDVGEHLGAALGILSVGMACGAAGIFLPSLRRVIFSGRGVAAMAGIAVLIQAIALQAETGANWVFAAGLVAVVLFSARINRGVAIGMMAAGFFVSGAITIHRANSQCTDVWIQQQMGCGYLLRGENPYSAKYPNIYGADTALYAPGMVDETNHLTFGYPYPPLSLLMDLPSYLLSGDVRYGFAAAVAIAAVLMGLSCDGRMGVLAAAGMLAAPQWPWIIRMGWIEPLVILNFSFAMFCACRWRKGLPWALGLFLASKQYAILAAPVLPLLMSGEEWRKGIWKTGVVLACVNVPFFVWGPGAIVRSILWVHAAQSFRPDALTYSAWVYRWTGYMVLPGWIAVAGMGVAMGEALWRGVKSPAGFAGAVTLVLMVFFAFNKQAFCNYYYFMMAAAWWAVGATKLAGAGIAAQDEAAAGRADRNRLIPV